MALLGGRVDHPLHTGREKMELSRVLIKILGSKVRQVIIETGMTGVS